jgi:hypothetical protein
MDDPWKSIAVGIWKAESTLLAVLITGGETA